MKSPYHVSVAQDYAVAQAQEFTFYYGYERTVANDEWCFQVKKDGKEIFLEPFGDLKYDFGLKDMYSVAECFMAGMAKFTLETQDKINSIL